MATFKNSGVVVMVVGIIGLGFAAACAPEPTYIQGADGCKGEDCEASSSSSGSSGKRPGGEQTPGSSSGSSGSSGTSSSGDPPAPPPPPPLPSTWKDSFAYTELAGGLAELTIKLTDYAGGCAVDEKGDSKKNSIYLKVAAKKTGATKIEAGTYKIGGTGSFAEASENRLDAACGKAKVTPTAGTLIIETVTATRAKGSYDMTFPSGTQKGKFDAALCNVPDGVNGACID